MVRKLSFLLVALIIMSLLLSGCTPKAVEETGGGEEDVIRIGVFEPMTGANAAGGALEVEGVELANKLYPEVLGKKSGTGYS